MDRSSIKITQVEVNNVDGSDLVAAIKAALPPRVVEPAELKPAFYAGSANPDDAPLHMPTVKGRSRRRGRK